MFFFSVHMYVGVTLQVKQFLPASHLVKLYFCFLLLFQAKVTALLATRHIGDTELQSKFHRNPQLAKTTVLFEFDSLCILMYLCDRQTRYVIEQKVTNQQK